MYQRFTPLPLQPRRLSPDLDMAVRIETPAGWLVLDEPGYDIEATSFSEQAVSWRKLETTSTWVEGSFTYSAVREDVTEQLSVWILGETRMEHEQYKEALKDALGQLSYRIMVRIEETVQYWDCEPADYTVSTGQEMRHARRALLKATIARKPDTEVAYAALDEM